MKIKKVLFNSITISLPKNMVQFLLGIILFWFLLGIPDIFLTLASLTAFLISYSAVYVYNDIVDHEEDRKDAEKRKWKLVAGDMINLKQAKIILAIFIVAGMGLSFFISKWFFLMIAAMLFLNLLHSSPRARFKKSLRKTSVNMTAIEFLKYSCGWFALTSDISKFPFWIIMAFSLVYMASYLIYKFKFKGSIIKGNKKMFVTIGLLGAFSYVVSFLQYGFPLSMILLIVIPLSILLLMKKIDIEFHKINNMIVIEYLLLPVVIISFLVLMVPFVGQANERIADTIDSYKEIVVNEIPENIMEHVDNLTGGLEKYKTIDDIQAEIETGIENITNATINK